MMLPRTGSSILDHDNVYLCRGRRIQMTGHSDLGIFNNFGASSISYLGFSRFCVRCLSVATWQSGDDIHDFCCCHLWCWWSLFGKYCVKPFIVFHNITSEYNSTFVFLVLCLQVGILQWQMSISEAIWTFAPFVLASSTSGSTPKFSPISPIPCPLLPLAAGIFMAWCIGINLWTKL